MGRWLSTPVVLYPEASLPAHATFQGLELGKLSTDIHKFVQQILSKKHKCSRHCSRNQREISEQNT